MHLLHEDKKIHPIISPSGYKPPPVFLVLLVLSTLKHVREYTTTSINNWKISRGIREASPL